MRFAADHPAFLGHFPGRPIVPGVLLVDGAQRAIEASTGLPLTGLATAKFLSPAAPDEELTLEFEVGEAAVRFEIRCATRRVASGRFLVAPMTPISVA
jgi:3-hydroxymyristoyl/3-hydroxydecanoyl-(acyl carrier protein) dehydratase